MLCKNATLKSQLTPRRLHVLKRRLILMLTVLEAAWQCHNHPCGLPLPRFMPATSRTGEKDNCVDILQNGSLARSSGMQIGEKVGLTISTCMLWTKREHIAGIKSSTGLLIWREDDAVHLTSAAYGDLAAVLSGHRQTLTIRSAEPPGGGLQVLCRQGSDSFANLSG